VPYPDYLEITFEDFNTKISVESVDDSTVLRVVPLAELKRFAQGRYGAVDMVTLQAIVHDWLLLTGAVQVPSEDGAGDGAAN
jgi:hypothetical protein